MKKDEFDFSEKIDAENYISRKAEELLDKDVPEEERALCVICDTLTIMGYILPVGMYDRPSQALLDFFENSDEIDSLYKDIAPLLYKNYKGHIPGSFKPWEVHEVLAKGINLWLGEEVDTFTEALVKDFNSIIESGSALAVSAKFDNSHELVSIFGTQFSTDSENLAEVKNIFERAEQLKELEKTTYPDKLIIKRFSKPVEKVDLTELISKIKPYNKVLSKWVHIFKAPHAII